MRQTIAAFSLFDSSDLGAQPRDLTIIKPGAEMERLRNGFASH